ncbi:DUF1049 domain-containing protein [Deltaproteobacteria bacterium TL4]
MRYFWLLLFGFFILISVLFIRQNFQPVEVTLSLEWINISYTSKRPLFIFIMVPFAMGIIFSVLYFATYHTHLKLKAKLLGNEVKRLKRLVLKEREQQEETKQRLVDLQLINERLDDQLQLSDEKLSPPSAKLLNSAS